MSGSYHNFMFVKKCDLTLIVTCNVEHNTSHNIHDREAKLCKIDGLPQASRVRCIGAWCKAIC